MFQFIITIIHKVLQITLSQPLRISFSIIIFKKIIKMIPIPLLLSNKKYDERFCYKSGERGIILYLSSFSFPQRSSENALMCWFDRYLASLRSWKQLVDRSSHSTWCPISSGSDPGWSEFIDVSRHHWFLCQVGQSGGEKRTRSPPRLFCCRGGLDHSHGHVHTVG